MIQGILLIACSIVALLWANVAPERGYAAFWELPLLGWPLRGWINEGLMSVFFLAVGLEIKRELRIGELSSRRKAMLPLIAAAGGMALPGVIYWLFNSAPETRAGWGIPIATDIAFALGALAAVKGAPEGLRAFLGALAVADDLGAVLVIALFYPGAHGAHGSVIGVILASLTPLAPGAKLERALRPWVLFGIMPLFALANAGVRIRGAALLHPVSLGIMIGLLVGKPVGITLFSWLSTRLGAAALPRGVAWTQLLGAATLGGIGFTMSLFIADLAFRGTPYLEVAKAGILAGSVLSSLAGISLLRRFSAPSGPGSARRGPAIS